MTSDHCGVGIGDVLEDANRDPALTDYAALYVCHTYSLYTYFIKLSPVLKY